MTSSPFVLFVLAGLVKPWSRRLYALLMARGWFCHSLWHRREAAWCWAEGEGSWARGEEEGAEAAHRIAGQWWAGRTL